MKKPYARHSAKSNAFPSTCAVTYLVERLMRASDQTMGKCRGTYAENADIIRKYAAAYLPAAGRLRG